MLVLKNYLQSFFCVECFAVEIIPSKNNNNNNNDDSETTSNQGNVCWRMTIGQNENCVTFLDSRFIKVLLRKGNFFCKVME